MLPRAIGDFLPAAVAVGLSPIVIIATVLVLSSPRARVTGPLFALGWVVGLTAIGVVGVVVFSGTDVPESEASAVLDWLRIGTGIAFVLLAGKKWRGRPRPGDAPPEPPSWMVSLESVTPLRALLIGLAMGGANPKNIGFGLAAAASIAEVGMGTKGTAIAVAVFVLVGSVAVLSLVVAHALFGQRAERALASVQDFMNANNAVIMMVLFLVIGAKVIGDGIEGLSA